MEELEAANRRILAETYRLTSLYMELQDQLPTTAMELQTLKNKLTADMADLDVGISINYNLRRTLIAKIIERLDAHAITATATFPQPPPGIVVTNRNVLVNDSIENQAIENVTRNFFQTQVSYLLLFVSCENVLV